MYIRRAGGDIRPGRKSSAASWFGCVLIPRHRPVVRSRYSIAVSSSLAVIAALVSGYFSTVFLSIWTYLAFNFIFS